MGAGVPQRRQQPQGRFFAPGGVEAHGAFGLDAYLLKTQLFNLLGNMGYMPVKD